MKAITLHLAIILPSTRYLAVLCHSANESAVSLRGLWFDIVENFLGEATIPESK